MSHATPENQTCPNCGFHTTHNYCAQCGQETHPHSDTFWGMAMHFIGHYFHYDSKFWKTIKALLFSPGKLTRSYWEGKRARYIPPISLYIFVSAVFFIVVMLNPNKIMKAHKGVIHFTATPMMDSASRAREEAAEMNEHPWYLYDPKRDTANLTHFIVTRLEVIDEKTEGNSGEYVVEQIYHTTPKIFFFMIPLMAFFLRLLFIRRRDMHFGAHSVFSLHVHSFIFTILLLLYIPFVKEIPLLKGIIFLLTTVYTLVALHNAYNTSWVKAFFSAVFLALMYTIFLLVAIAADILAILYFA